MGQKIIRLIWDKYYEIICVWVEIVNKEKLSSVSHIANDDLKLKRIYDTHHLVKCCLTIGKG